MKTFDGIVRQVAQAVDPQDLPTLRDLRLAYLVLVLKLCDDNKSKAARVLGVDVKTIYNHLKELEALRPRRTMTEVVKELDTAMSVKEGADFHVGPDQADRWGVEPGHYRWQAGEAVRIGDWPS